MKKIFYIQVLRSGVSLFLVSHSTYLLMLLTACKKNNFFFYTNISISTHIFTFFLPFVFKGHQKKIFFGSKVTGFIHTKKRIRRNERLKKKSNKNLCHVIKEIDYDHQATKSPFSLHNHNTLQFLIIHIINLTEHPSVLLFLLCKKKFSSKLLQQLNCFFFIYYFFIISLHILLSCVDSYIRVMS